MKATIPSIPAHFASNGLTYSDTQIADFYTALQTKGFVVLSGISGTGKSKIAQYFTKLLPSPVEPNTLFLSVRPDWRDSTSLLGYYNPLLEAYEWTEFLRFILKAAENCRSENPVAWFVILDEMNLAHVEYYFADMLSVLESGRDDSGFSRESLRLTFPDDLANEVPPHQIFLPPNLYIIGTVNMDETTHAFSPKVLDRAFTMELTDVDFTNYPTNLEASADELTEAQKEAFLAQFSQQGLYPGIRKDEIAAYVARNPQIRELLQSLNTMLAQHRFHFGYRVFDEIVQFLSNAEENGMYDDWWAALDSAAYMKILPKFSGSEARVGKPLEILVAWANDPFGDGIDTPLLPRLHQRAVQMQEQLQIDGFVTAF
ncbi:MAG: hypothetical protein M9934_04905 [Thermomicrobiales bacterium]|nr:hypothetical protein [Thermomicrobiales bacterium]